MAIDIKVRGNAMKVSGFATEALYDNVNNLKPEINGDKVRIINYNEERTLLPDTDFNDFDTPNGTALGSAEAVADAIADLLVAGVANLDPSTAGAELTPVAADAATKELMPANPDRVEAFIRNDGTGILYITEGADATANSAIKLLQDDVHKVTGTLVVNGIWVAPNGNAVINEKTR